MSLLNKLGGMKKKLNFSGVGAYDNTAAHNYFKELMLRHDILTVRFANDSFTKLPCAWIETKDVKAFKYILFEESFLWLVNYLRNGEVEDVDVNPLGNGEYEPSEDDFQLEVLRGFVEAEMKLQFTPLFLDRSEHLTAIVPFQYGKVLFKIKRTSELLDYLRGKGVRI